MKPETKTKRNKELSKAVNLEFPFLDIKYRQLIYLFTINKIDNEIKKVFDSLLGYEFNAFLNVSCTCYEAERQYLKIIEREMKNQIRGLE